MNEYEEILKHLPPALLVVFRIGGLTLFAPIFGAAVIPIRVRVFLSFLIGFAVYPLLATKLVPPEGLSLHLWTLAPAIALELMVGLLVGWVASIPLIAVQTGGLVMGQQMGLGFARFYNPAIDDEADVVGQMLFFLALVGFLMIGGHEALVLAILHSFEHIPLAGFTIDHSLIDLLTGILLASLELALRVAAPVLAVVFLQSTAMGFLAKTVPQLNILSLGFPLRILIGLSMIMIGLAVINEVAMDFFNETLEVLFRWIES